MDQRRQPRLQTDQEVKVTCLDLPHEFHTAKLVNISEYGMALVMNRRLPPGSSVKVEWENTLLLGELIYCRSRGEEFVMGFNLEEAVYNTAELLSIAENWK